MADLSVLFKLIIGYASFWAIKITAYPWERYKFKHVRMFRDLVLRNKIYYHEGHGCRRLVRFHQIVTTDTSEGICPHCKEGILMTSCETKEKPWMKYHADCPKQTIVEYVQFQIRMRQIAKAMNENKEAEAFDEYNSRKPNVEWVENYAELLRRKHDGRDL